MDDQEKLIVCCIGVLQCIGFLVNEGETEYNECSIFRG